MSVRNFAIPLPQDAPTDFVKGRWEKHVMQEEHIERHAYELCTLSELRGGLRSGDIWVAGSRRYKAFEEYLMPQGQWQWLKQAGETEVEISCDFATYIAERKELLHQELTKVEKLLAEEKLPDVRQGKGKLIITSPTKVVPDEVEALTRQVYDVLPRIKLPDLLLEVDAWTGFSRHFTHLQSGDPPKDRTALFAALLADAINLGYSKMADACPGMTFDRLAWFVDWYVRDENHTKALAEVIPRGTLRQRHPKGTQLPISTIIPYVKHIADALQYAHDEKLIHRDIKPENILLGRNNEKYSISHDGDSKAIHAAVVTRERHADQPWMF